MKQTEITVEVFDNLEEINKILVSQGFKVIENYHLNDYYFSKYDNISLNQMGYKEIMANSFLIRQINDGQIRNLLIFKNKTIDDNNIVIEEEKVQLKIESLELALKIFKLANLNCWSELKQNIFVFKKEDIEFCVSEIENLGIFIEFEENSKINNLQPYEKIEYMKSILKSLNLKLGNDYSCKKPYLKFKKLELHL